MIDARCRRLKRKSEEMDDSDRQPDDSDRQPSGGTERRAIALARVRGLGRGRGASS